MVFKETCSNELLNILNILQSDEYFVNYFLAGGTSLSLQIGHRMSKDIDLFTLNVQNNENLKNKIYDLFTNFEIINDKANILQIIINDIKVDFVSAKGKLTEPPVVFENYKLCHYKDIAGMKLNTISGETGRKKAKDYVDIAYLIDILTLPVMLDIYKYKYDKTNILNVKKDLLDVSYINPYTWQDVQMVSNKILLSDVPKIIKDAVYNYDKIYEIKNKCIFDFFKPRSAICIKHTHLTGKDFSSVIINKNNDLKILDDFSDNNLNGKYGSIIKFSYKNNENKLQFVIQQIKNFNIKDYSCDIWHFNDNLNKKSALEFIKQWNKSNLTDTIKKGCPCGQP